MCSSDLSEIEDSGDLEMHGPNPSVAVKIKTFPIHLESRLETLSKAQHKFDFNADNEMVDKSIFLGLRQFDNQSIYLGQWFQKKRNGRGQLIYPDGSVYEGYWINDKRQGKGRFVDVSGDTYEGDWKDDSVNGKGKYTLKNGAYFFGDWIDNKQHGRGKEKWPTGEVYEGEYRNGSKHGKGVFKTIDGSYYEGDFFEGKIEGLGRAFLMEVNITGKMEEIISENGETMKEMAEESFSGLQLLDTLETIVAISKKEKVKYFLEARTISKEILKITSL